ncbi:hypothetical protein CO2235_170119 [Cupriavidus oxalaticus]|uniref:Uncharacterized protein n=1 Tax=Cupriavidus oxalaticus TaxID=96344 RepID=A0A375G4M3_9BURK|nr:hypothetical protein CO2235_170119 [Cupriavidus oxalaticus]
MPPILLGARMGRRTGNTRAKAAQTLERAIVFVLELHV